MAVAKQAQRAPQSSEGSTWLSKSPEEPLLVLPGPAGLLLAALLLDTSSSSPYIQQNGQLLQRAM